ncbi:helix-turn-helix domain-containing protein [Actinomadura macra]|uniref:helix-turn-helix domain-containing protein n=1 Tax=Actinomadura macra TaxID=46164 RepID=UPI00082C3D78|nr:helix-turn-helix domain-containing protein [Actinomadura macra]
MAGQGAAREAGRQQEPFDWHCDEWYYALRTVAPAEAARSLRVSTQTLRRWAERGHVRAWGLDHDGTRGRTLRYSSEDVRALAVLLAPVTAPHFRDVVRVHEPFAAYPPVTDDGGWSDHRVLTEAVVLVANAYEKALWRVAELDRRQLCDITAGATRELAQELKAAALLRGTGAGSDAGA